jgi:CRP-like cAMP-binding protein
MLRSNAILASLSASDTAALQPYLRPVELQQKTVLYNTGDLVNHVYFPTTAVISLVVALITGETSEAAMVGNDGAVGMSSVLDGRMALNRAIVQLGGEAMVCSPAAFRSAVLQSEKLLGTVLRHEQAVFAQAQQSTARMAQHEVGARLCRCCFAPATSPAATICRSPRNFLGNAWRAAHERNHRGSHVAGSRDHPVLPWQYPDFGCRTAQRFGL